MDTRDVVLVGPPGYPWMILPKPRKFTLRARLEPAGVFGTEEAGVLVLPSPAGGVTDDQTVLPFTDVDPSQSRPANSPFGFTDQIADVTLRITGNIAQVEGWGMNAQIVFVRMSSMLRRLLQMMSVHLAVGITGQVEAFMDEQNGPIKLPVSNVVTISFYDFPSLTSALTWSRRAVEAGDVTYRRAVQYFLAGLSCYGAWEAYQRSRKSPCFRLEDESDDAIWISAFLHFWKAITVILTEPSKNPKRDASFVERSKALNLVPEDVDLIRTLKEIRDDFDVAHKSEDEFEQNLPRRNVTVVQDVAHSVILACLAMLETATHGFGPSDEALTRRRQGRRSTLHRVRGPKPSRVRRLVIGRTIHNQSMGVSHSPGQDVVTWRIPTSRTDDDQGSERRGTDFATGGPANKD